jgi:hypothetical protein
LEVQASLEQNYETDNGLRYYHSHHCMYKMGIVLRNECSLA